jgi:hypothetical protein
MVGGQTLPDVEGYSKILCPAHPRWIKRVNIRGVDVNEISARFASLYGRQRQDARKQQNSHKPSSHDLLVALGRESAKAANNLDQAC